MTLVKDTPLERATVVTLVQQAVALNLALGDPTDLASTGSVGERIVRAS